MSAAKEIVRRIFLLSADPDTKCRCAGQIERYDQDVNERKCYFTVSQYSHISFGTFMKKTNPV